MVEHEENVKKHLLQLETLTTTNEATGEVETHLEVATNEEFWSNIFALKTDNALMRGFFSGESDETREKYFKFGIACFACFIQANFTGPGLNEKITSFFDREQFKNKDYAQRLSMSNNEDINVNTQYPILLLVSEIIFDSCIADNIVNLWWCCRALVVHQEILDELSPTLLSNADRLYKLIQAATISGRTKAELDIELAQLYLRFRYISKAREHIKSASTILGISYNFSGKLGKRTKFQERELAQLTLEVKQEPSNVEEKQDFKPVHLPHNVALNDDVRLDKIEYSSTTCSDPIHLGKTEQKLFLTIFDEIYVSTPSDELRTEELQTILDMILGQTNTIYPVRFISLLLRCRLENKHRRTIERCLKQCEELVSFFGKTKPLAIDRMVDVFGTAFPPNWKTQTLYADILLTFGLIKQSLGIYMNIKSWDDVIGCYTLLNMRHKAEKLIRDLIQIKPTVKLLCLLGDATDDVSIYEEAWQLSRKRSHRAQRHWGQHLFERKRYSDAIPHFEKSLSINPLQPAIWMRLGYAAQQIENWHTAATAYRRYTTLEPNGYEAWNNLAQAYIKIGNKRSAYQALLEALKCCDHDNWKVWENLLVVSADVGKYFDVIRAYHRLLDLKDNKYTNCEVLSMLVGHVKDMPDEESRPGGLLQKTRELIGRIVLSNPLSGCVWKLYADLAPLMLLRTQRLQKAYRCYTMQTNWDKDLNTIKHVLDLCGKMAELVLDEEFSDTDMVVKSVRLNISAAITAVKKHDINDVNDQLEAAIHKLHALNVKMDKNAPKKKT